MMTTKTTFIQWQTFVTGLLMGGADLVPGISGGTVALLSDMKEMLIRILPRVELVITSVQFQKVPWHKRGIYHRCMYDMQFQTLVTNYGRKYVMCDMAF